MARPRLRIHVRTPWRYPSRRLLRTAAGASRPPGPAADTATVPPYCRNSSDMGKAGRPLRRADVVGRAVPRRARARRYCRPPAPCGCSRASCNVPIGRCGGVEGSVRQDLAAERRAVTKAGRGLTIRRDRGAENYEKRCVPLARESMKFGRNRDLDRQSCLEPRSATLMVDRTGTSGYNRASLRRCTGTMGLGVRMNPGWL